MEERRVFERIGAAMKIKYEIVAKAATPLKKADTEDVSGGGIKLTLAENLTPGTTIKLTIDMPEGANKVTTAYGKVIWSRKIEITGTNTTRYYETGVKFTKVDALVLGKIFKHFEEQKR